MLLQPSKIDNVIHRKIEAKKKINLTRRINTIHMYIENEGENYPRIK